jgi:hypothetical protein
MIDEGSDDTSFAPCVTQRVGRVSEGGGHVHSFPIRWFFSVDEVHLRAEVAYDEIDLSCIVFLFIFLVPLDFFVVCL